jgi:tetratricopeptide (TPR) repeat protein
MALFLRLPRLDYFALLGISVKASVSDVKIAYGGFLRKWRLEHVPDEWSDEAKRAAEALLDRATEALTVLTDTERRHRYLQQRATGGSTVYEEDRQVLLAGVALQKAGRARERGELDEAEQILRRALEKVPEEASLWLRLGIVLVDKVREGERALQEEAVQVLRKAVSLDPALDLPWVYIGRLAEVRGEVDLAAKLYRKALSVNPESELAASGLKSLERRKEGKGSLIDRLLGKKK